MFPPRCECGRRATNRVVLRVRACTIRSLEDSPPQISWWDAGSARGMRTDEYDACGPCTREFQEVYGRLEGSTIEIYLLEKEQIA